MQTVADAAAEGPRTPLQSVIKVLDCLEHLSLRGITPSLALLPDYVDELEVSEEEFSQLLGVVQPDERLLEPEAARIMLGGHAGIGALTLAHLRDVNDYSFRIAYISKIGDRQRDLKKNLEDRLAHFGRAFIDDVYIFDGGDNRRLLAHRGTSQRIVMPVGRSELTVEELASRREVLGALRSADAILSTVEADTIFALTTRETLGATVLVDSIFEVPPGQHAEEAAGAHQARVAAVEQRNRTYAARLSQLVGSDSVISMSESEVLGYAKMVQPPAGGRSEENDPISAAHFLAAHFDSQILLHTSQYSLLVGDEPCMLVPGLLVNKVLSVNGAGDTFNSAFLLASTIRKCATDARRHATSQAQMPKDKIPDLEDCLIFATAVAATRILQGDFCTDEDVLVAVCNDLRVRDLTTLPELAVAGRFGHELLRLSSDSAGRISFESQRTLIDFINDAAIPRWRRFAALLGCLRQPWFPDVARGGAGADLAPVAFVRGLRKLKPSAAERRVVFVDLDHTLFDSKECREGVVLAALRELGSNLSDDHLLDIYRLVYGDHQFYAAPSSMRVSFRYDWFHGDLFRLMHQLIIGRHIRTGDQYRAAHEQNGFFKDVSREIDEARSSSAIEALVHRAVSSLEGSTFRPYDDARQFLATLRGLGYEPYLVTEGNRHTQTTKLDKLGLNDFFGASGVLVSQAAENPPELDARLQRAERKATGSIREDLKRLRSLAHEIAEHRKQYFQSLAVRAAMESPGAPAAVFARLAGTAASIERSAYPMKLAVVGDRYDIDCRPYRQLDPLGRHIRTVRIRRGAHKDDSSPFPFPPSHYEVRNLYEALGMLMSDKTWGSLECVEMPRVEPYVIPSDVETQLRAWVSSPNGTLSAYASMVSDLAFEA